MPDLDAIRQSHAHVLDPRAEVDAGTIVQFLNRDVPALLDEIERLTKSVKAWQDKNDHDVRDLEDELTQQEKTIARLHDLAEDRRFAANKAAHERDEARARLDTVRALLDSIEGSYVGELNSVLAATDDNSPDVHRGRGRAETLSLVASLLRASLGLPSVEYGSTEWQAAHGVYTDEQVAQWRALSVEDDGLCGDCLDGRCHGGEPDECGCDRHEASTKDGA